MSADTGQTDAPAPAGTWHHQVVEQIDGWAWIRTLNDQLTAWLGPLRESYQDNPLLELMHGGRWTGHPLHPALSDLPIGFWSSALLLDLLGSGDPEASPVDPATLFCAAGIVGGLAAATTGVVDWTVSDNEDRRLGLFHGVLQTAALSLQGLSLTARLSGRRTTGAVLGGAGLAVCGAAAYLGGHLVFGKAVMVSRVAGADGPRRWVKVVEDTELADDTPTGVMADGRQILLYRHDGTLYALDNLCSHAAGLLSRGEVHGLTVTCPLHGSQFCLADGSVSRGPSHQPQPVIRTRVRNGWIEVRGNQPAPRRRASSSTSTEGK